MWLPESEAPEIDITGIESFSSLNKSKPSTKPPNSAGGCATERLVQLSKPPEGCFSSFFLTMFISPRLSYRGGPR